MILSTNSDKKITYVGYSLNPAKRIILHNKGKGAKFTRGKKWKLLYKKKFSSKKEAMKYEYLLKKDKIKRIELKKKY